MAIIARASSGSGESFTPAPVGLHRAICCDVVDLGMVPSQWGDKHKVRVIWQTEATMPDGKPYLVDQRYTLSLDEKSNLRRDLEAWRGRAFTLTEAAGFDLERLVGVSCCLVIVHKAGKEAGKVFANVQAVLPAIPGQPLAVRDYVRVTDRTPGAAEPAHPSIGPSYPASAPVAAQIPKPFNPDPFGDDVPHPALTADQIPF